MRIFNRVMATIFSIAIIVASAIGILYLVGVLVGIPALTQLVRGAIQSITGLNTAQAQAALVGVFLVALLLLILEIRPWRARFIHLRDDARGQTRIFRSDVEQYLLQRYPSQPSITPEAMGVTVHGNRFDVATDVAVSSEADRQAVRSQVEYDVRKELESIGLDDELDTINTRISHVKKVA